MIEIASFPTLELPDFEVMEELCWHYTSSAAFEKIKASGLLKSRALLIAEELKARPDWNEIKGDRDKILAILAALPRQQYDDLQLKPIVWFSRDPYWDCEACVLPDVVRATQRRLIRPTEVRLSQHADVGLIRLGVPVSKLATWSQILKTAHNSTWKNIFWTVKDRLSSAWAQDIENRVLGYIGESLPLSEIERIERYEVGRGWTSFKDNQC